MLLLAAAEARRRSLGVSGLCTISTGDHRFPLKLGKMGSLVDLRVLMCKVMMGNASVA